MLGFVVGDLGSASFSTAGLFIVSNDSVTPHRPRYSRPVSYPPLDNFAQVVAPSLFSMSSQREMWRYHYYIPNVVTLNLSQIQAEKRKLHFARPAFTAMQTVSLFKLHTGLWSIKKKQEQKARASAHWSLSSWEHCTHQNTFHWTLVQCTIRARARELSGLSVKAPDVAVKRWEPALLPNAGHTCTQTLLFKKIKTKKGSPHLT